MKRSIPLSIILSILTCGIYAIYWMYSVNEDVKELSGDRSLTGGGMVILLTIVTCSIYSIYWAYKMGKAVQQAEINRGSIAPSDDSVLYVILSIFSLDLVVFAILQSKINKMVVSNG